MRVEPLGSDAGRHHRACLWLIDYSMCRPAVPTGVGTDSRDLSAPGSRVAQMFVQVSVTWPTV
jgi:hypothetical protein